MSLLLSVSSGGTVIVETTASTSGVAAVTGIGAALDTSAGASAGSASVTGLVVDITASVAASNGTSAVTGVTTAVLATLAASDGTSVVTGSTTALAVSDGTATGISLVDGIAEDIGVPVVTVPPVQTGGGGLWPIGYKKDENKGPRRPVDWSSGFVAGQNRTEPTELPADIPLSDMDNEIRILIHRALNSEDMKIPEAIPASVTHEPEAILLKQRRNRALILLLMAA